MPEPPWAECRRLLAHHSRSFHLASRLLPRARRDEIAALYAWCRTCDDAIDLTPASGRAAALASLRARLESVYAGQAQEEPVLRCFQEVVRRHRIPLEYPAELLRGMAMDVEPSRYADVDRLLLYAWRVAGTVGLMTCHVMGVADPEAAPRAAHLGIAMQLTNICRDVAEDWERGRIYLPARWLDPELAGWLAAHQALETRPPLPEQMGPSLARTVTRLLDLADRYYASADLGIRSLDPRSALAIRTARLVYSEIGSVLRARDCDVLRGRAVVSRRRKLQLVARSLALFAAERRRWRARELVAPPAVLEATEAVRLA